MPERIRELDELHAAGQGLLDALCEIVDLSKRLAERFAEKKQPTKGMRTEIAQRVDDWRSLSRSYGELQREDRFIKVWWLLQDTLIDVHMREADIFDCPVWKLIESQKTLHCHDALLEVSNTLNSSRLPQSAEPSLRRFATLANDDALSIVTGDLFAHFFDSEIAVARKQLSQRHGEEFPFCAVSRFCARRECLRRMTEHARGCLELSRTFVRIKGMQRCWSKSAYVATRQAEDHWKRVENDVSRIAKDSRRFREVPDSLELLDWIRKANVEHLKEVIVQGKPFATAHESIEWLERIIDDAIEECDGFTERENVDELTETVRQIEIPDLDALLLIEQERTEKWLEARLESEQQLEPAETRRESLDEQTAELKTQKLRDSPGRSRPKRRQGRPLRSEVEREALLERQFDSIYRQTKDLKEACRRCGIDEKHGMRLRSRLQTREHRRQTEEDRKRRHGK